MRLITCARWLFTAAIGCLLAFFVVTLMLIYAPSAEGALKPVSTPVIAVKKAASDDRLRLIMTTVSQRSCRYITTSAKVYLNDKSAEIELEVNPRYITRRGNELATFGIYHFPGGSWDRVVIREHHRCHLFWETTTVLLDSPVANIKLADE